MDIPNPVATAHSGSMAVVCIVKVATASIAQTISEIRRCSDRDGASCASVDVAEVMSLWKSKLEDFLDNSWGALTYHFVQLVCIVAVVVL